MRVIYIVFFFFFLCSIGMYATPVTWQVKENDFENSMTLVSFVNLDAKRLASSKVKVGAFVNGNCRGVSTLTYVPSKKAYYCYMTIFSNTPQEKIFFKVYDPYKDKVQDIPTPISFEINGHRGDLFQPYSIAYPSLSKKAALTEVSFKDVLLINKKRTSSIFTIKIKSKNKPKLLKPVFKTSSGSTIWHKGKLVLPGDVLGFSDTLILDVLSQDKSVLKTYKIVFNTVFPTTIFYKKDAVCYAKGQIKVIYALEDTEVYLYKRDKVEPAFLTGVIKDSSLIFKELDQGVYYVKFHDIEKKIEINLKLK